MKRTRLLPKHLIAGIASLLAITTVSHAATSTWNAFGAGPFQWNAGASWIGGGIANAGGDLTLTLNNTAGNTAVIKFNGGQLGLSNNSAIDPNWVLGKCPLTQWRHSCLISSFPLTRISTRFLSASARTSAFAPIQSTTTPVRQRNSSTMRG